MYVRDQGRSARSKQNSSWTQLDTSNRIPKEQWRPRLRKLLPLLLRLLRLLQLLLRLLRLLQLLLRLLWLLELPRMIPALHSASLKDVSSFSELNATLIAGQGYIGCGWLRYTLRCGVSLHTWKLNLELFNYFCCMDPIHTVERLHSGVFEIGEKVRYWSGTHAKWVWTTALGGACQSLRFSWTIADSLADSKQLTKVEAHVQRINYGLEGDLISYDLTAKAQAPFECKASA